MIGSAKITYTNEDVCQLVRKDLVDKFGNRELANYNLYLPGVIKPKAVIDQYPDPVVKVTSVEEQIKDMGVYPKQKVNRNPDSARVVPDLFGSILSSQFNYRTGNLYISGGPVTWTTAEVSGQDHDAHWYAVEIDLPLGCVYSEDDLIPYSLNGEPLVHCFTGLEESTGFITIFLDAKYTTADLLIHWDNAHAPEKIAVTCNASLESPAIDKIPAFPTEPKFEFTYPKATIDSMVQVDVDLDLGRV